MFGISKATWASKGSIFAERWGLFFKIFLSYICDWGHLQKSYDWHHKPTTTQSHLNLADCQATGVHASIILFLSQFDYSTQSESCGSSGTFGVFAIPVPGNESSLCKVSKLNHKMLRRICLWWMQQPACLRITIEQPFHLAAWACSGAIFVFTMVLLGSRRSSLYWLTYNWIFWKCRFFSIRNPKHSIDYI